MTDNDSVVVMCLLALGISRALGYVLGHTLGYGAGRVSRRRKVI